MLALRVALLVLSLSSGVFTDGPSPSTASAVIEQVFRTEEDGYVQISYLVTWKHQPAIIADAIHQTDLKVGDRITFVVMKHDLESRSGGQAKKLLHFEILPLRFQKPD